MLRDESTELSPSAETWRESVFLELFEFWKPIEGFVGYDVSSFGRVRTWSGKGRPGMTLPYVLKLHVNRSARQERKYARLYDGKTTKHVRVSRLVAKAFLPPPPTVKHMLRHDDGDSLNDRATNLLWGTALENSADMVRHGTRMEGVRHWRTKLTAESVKEIRRLAESGNTYASLSRTFGVNPDQISRIVNKKRWRSVD